MAPKWESVDMSTFFVYDREEYAPPPVTFEDRPLDEERWDREVRT